MVAYENTYKNELIELANQTLIYLGSTHLLGMNLGGSEGKHEFDHLRFDILDVHNVLIGGWWIGMFEKHIIYTYKGKIESFDVW